MKVGVVATVFDDLPLEWALDRVRDFGIEAVELGAGNYVGAAHLDPARVLEQPDYAEYVRREFQIRGLEIAALAVHGNPLHPVRTIAQEHDHAIRRACDAAVVLGVRTLTLFSGCPGDRDGGSTPNWVLCSWPPEFESLSNWQWNEVLIPYWRHLAHYAAERGLRLAIEMHPGMSVYNPTTLLRLRQAAGDTVGANLDPSHLLWQNVDVFAAIRALARAGALFHVHAKDTSIDRGNLARNGVLDPTPADRLAERAWSFRTVGFGQGEGFWRELVEELRSVAFEGTLAIEHEDRLLSRDEALAHATALLRRCLAM